MKPVVRILPLAVGRLEPILVSIINWDGFIIIVLPPHYAVISFNLFRFAKGTSAIR
jgi:hypothetical protein